MESTKGYSVEHEPDHLAMNGNKGCFERMRASTTVVVIIVFFSLLTDSLLLTLVDPILPQMLQKLEGNATQELDVQEINTNGRYGFLVAAKGAAQFVCNPFIGILVTRFGYRRIMLVGDVLLLASSVAFAYGRNYGELLAIRLAQGVSSSVTAVTGMGLLAATFTDDTKRGKVMGIAIGGISFGIIVGPVYGSTLYEFVGEDVPFLVLGAMVLFTLVLQALTVQADRDSKDHSMKSIMKLVCDPLIMIVAGNIFLLNLNVSVVLAFLPIHLLELTTASTWQLGIVVLPTSIGYLISGFICPRTTAYCPRWLSAFLGMLVSSITLFVLAFCETFIAMLIVTTFLGVALGMISTSMQPIFALLVDLRHSSVYGNVYALSDMAVCLAMTIGPLVGGVTMYALGFRWMVLGIAVINMVYSQFSIILRNVRPANDISEHSDRTITEDTFRNANDGTDDESAPLLSSRSRRESERSTRSCPTMDISPLPTARYMDCLSGVEDFYSEPESIRTARKLRRKHAQSSAYI